MITPGIIDVEPLLPPLRPLREFLAYTSLRNHKQPLRARILDSITFFQTNYLLINMIMLCLPMLFSYLFFPVLVLALSLFFFLAYHKSDNIIVLRRIKVTKNLAILTCLFALVLLVLVSGMYTTLFVGYIFTVFFVMSHACLTDRRRTQPSFQQDDSNGASRIFDPEEIIRRDEMQRRNFQQPMTGYSTSNRFMTPGTIQPTSYEPSSSTDASTNAEDDSKRYKKEKIEQTRKLVQQPKSIRGGGGKQSSPLVPKDEIADFKERLRQQQQEPNNKQKTSNRKGVSEREVLLKEAQQLLNEDSIIISPSRSLLDAIEKDLQEAGFSDGSDDDDEDFIFNSSNNIVDPPRVETSKKITKPTTTKVSPQKTRPIPQTKPVTPKSIKVAPQPDHNPLDLDRQRLVNDRLEDVSSQISKIEKAISIYDQKEREIKNQKREECEKEKAVIKDKQTSLENMYMKIDTLQKKQDKELKILTREKKKLKEQLVQNEQKKNSLMKERDSLLSIPKDRRRNPVEDKLIQTREHLIEVIANIERITSKLGDIDNCLKELENDESEWLSQISTNSMLLEGSALTDDQKKNLTTLIRREKEIYLRTERLREKFPLEIFLIDLKFEYNRAIDELNSKKKFAESKRQEVCELIDEKRIILEELEQENLTAKQDYVERKENGIENLQNEMRRLSALENYIHTMSIEIEETEAILAHATELSSEEFDFQQLRECVDSFNAGFLAEEIELEQQVGFASPFESIIKTFKKLYINQSESFVDSEGKKTQKREEYISLIRDKLERDKRLVDVAKEKISSSSIGEVERENSERKRGELERLGHFSNIVSELEQQIGGLIRDRQECDEEIESIVSQLNEIEESYNKEKEEVEKQVADKIENSTDDEMKLTEERFVRCEALVGSYYQIKDVIQRIVETSQCEKVAQYVDASNNIENQVKVINKQKLEKQDELEKTNEDYESMVSQKEKLEKEIDDLESQEKQFESEITKEKASIESRIQEIDTLLAIIEEDIKENITDYDTITKPLEKSVALIEQDLNNLTNSTMSLKKQLALMKKNLEDIEASFTGKISQVRAQRQHLRHRLELKLQAVENVKNSGADIIMRSIKPSKNEKCNPPVSKSGYYSMYMKNKDPNSLDDFDDDYFTDLAERENEDHSEDENRLDNSNEEFEDEDEHYENETEIAHEQAIPETSKPAQKTTPKKLPTNTSNNTTVTSYQQNPPKAVISVASSNISRLLASKQYKLFGPNSKPLSKEDVQFVLDKFQFMCNGTLLHKKKSNTEYVVRHVSLSQEFTRILIRDNKKKIPESFLKVEHIDKISKSKEPTTKSLEGGFSLVIVTDKKKMEFVTFEERDYNNWVDGLSLLIENKQNLFSLKYNIRDLLTNVQ